MPRWGDSVGADPSLIESVRVHEAVETYLLNGEPGPSARSRPSSGCDVGGPGASLDPAAGCSKSVLAYTKVSLLDAVASLILSVITMNE